ncbi:MAG: bifunctional phosphopantothenoylcysteine decarboxylase/phosphopantothenate--cysteine ligase CoaBC [candidate division Zixibacteria bacterium]|nr:bifunctional phosphopantothenoylcysteine decarboxylase/phosphopantothenate--cysteine ligase CoaBC [candidate division Zixibacteria bacterium]NIR63254.1 bifunctional phosphopantothenoylcysteine decarboxylase/phosphopantothenate--cysteine ligase CoaBC [candidate division Zixibacteria bacterium]NIS17114.1 bifunctional phosphopantothenoylcysteine decarboxylase/phosphopantothenate--cysteine ligase CoaBC [candidate division Zixibacteria bacterium]NIS45235.1 bifunctional phosphopantothenoylcysteine 
MRLTNKKIVLGITGCIAAYKAAFLVRLLKKEGAEVKVLMTSSAKQFITPLTLETLSENPVNSELFPKTGYYATHHISLAEWADLILIAPATGNIIGKIASGIADDLLSTVVMAAQSPVMIAPAMNTQMYTNPVVQENMKKLVNLGYKFLDPTIGEMACRTYGVGRLPDPDEILEEVVNHFGQTLDMHDLKVLVTAGPTVEHIDAVRYVSNPSSGKMGYAMAQKAKSRGAEVVLISGPAGLSAPSGVELIKVKSGEEMFDRIKEHFGQTDILYMVAAVSDYVPVEKSEHKIKKSAENISLVFKPQIDILQTLAQEKKEQVLVGFSMETDNAFENAKEKLKKKNLDMIVLNDLGAEGSGFGVDTNKVTIIDRNGKIEDLPLASKAEIADKIIEYSLRFIKKENN